MSIDVPYISSDLEGIGGELKAIPADFVVEEIPLYEPEGRGDHIYFRIRREGMTTREITESLMRLFKCYETDIGSAGLKDKHALVTQSFSVYQPSGNIQEAAKRVRGELGVVVERAKRHRNKLKTGHLTGNRFTILVTEVAAGQLEQARLIGEALVTRGIPNYYGDQRFGNTGNNATQGREILSGGGPRQRWLRRFLVSSFMSSLFNKWLAERMVRGDWDRVYVGDIAKKTKTGGIFEVKDADVETERLKQHEITYTGPIYGHRMSWPTGQPGKWEREILEAENVSKEVLRQYRVDGTRRAGRLYVEGMAISPKERGLEFSFELPKGAYATTVLREFMKASTTVEGLEEETNP